MDDKIIQIRKQIDQIDSQIHQLLNDRAKLAIAISKQKINQNKLTNPTNHFYRPEREAQIFDNIKKFNKGPLSNESVLLIFREIMSACLALESPLKVCFLGPVGTFTQQAAYKHFGSSIEAIATSSIEDVFRSVELDRADFGVVPIENSSEGVVSYTLDCLQNSSLNICGEVQIAINHQLIAKNKDIKIDTIYAHPQSFAQCRKFLSENYPKVNLNGVSSNAFGAQKASENDNSAAIGSEICANIHNLNIIAQNIQDSSTNTTRFLVIGKYKCKLAKENKTSLLLSTTNKPGSLYTMLKPFEKYHLNMTKIESRPSKFKQWDYVFFIDIDGHLEDKDFQKVLKELENYSHYVRILGSYPKRLTS